MTVVELKELTAGYAGKGIDGLHNLCMEIHQGEIICLMGRNGSGKSTLLRTILGLISPVSGEVMVAGQPVHGMKRNDRARLMAGVLTGVPRPGFMKVNDFIGTGRFPFESMWRHDAMREEKIRTAAAHAGCQNLLHKHVTETSDGEFQRILVARLLAQEARCWILDEPTAFLDIAGRFDLYNLLDRTASAMGVAVIVSSHDAEMAGREGVKVWLLKEDGINVLPGGDATRSAVLDYFCSSYEV